MIPIPSRYDQDRFFITPFSSNTDFDYLNCEVNKEGFKGGGGGSDGCVSQCSLPQILT